MAKARLGGHFHLDDGVLHHLVVNTRALGYNVVQTMIGAQTMYEPYHFSEKDTQNLRTMLYGVDLYIHLPYMINPCESISRRTGWYKKTFRAFCAAAAEIGAKAVVIHPGSKKEQTLDQARTQATRFFESTYQEDWGLDVLIETDAGARNGNYTGSVEFITDLLKELQHSHFGMVIDTEHLYARGVNLWNRDTLENLIENHHRTIRLVHLNVPDPGVELGSNRDRHNSPFLSRNWDHLPLIETLLKLYPCILERASIAVQEQDASYVRTLFPDLFQKEIT